MMIPQLLAVVFGAQVFGAQVFGPHVAIEVADRIPNFNVEPSCNAAGAALFGGAQDKATCLKDENDARVEIEKQWPQFNPSDRTACVAAASGWHPIYTELLTCLEMSRDVRKLHSETPPGRNSNSPHM